MTYGVAAHIGVHRATGIELRLGQTEDGATKWMDFIVTGKDLSGVEVTVYAGHAPALWQTLGDLVDAWHNAQLKPAPVEEEAADEGAFRARLDYHGAETGHLEKVEAPDALPK